MMVDYFEMYKYYTFDLRGFWNDIFRTNIYNILYIAYLHFHFKVLEHVSL